jgi:hypothetical protein
VERVELIRVDSAKGRGVEGDPVHSHSTYFTLDGERVVDICSSYNWRIGTTPEAALNAPEWSGRTRPIMVDACIAPTVQAIWDAGHHTLGSCCGHGRTPPSLVLADDTDPDAVRAVIAAVDPRTFTLLQWQQIAV